MSFENSSQQAITDMVMEVDSVMEDTRSHVSTVDPEKVLPNLTQPWAQVYRLVDGFPRRLDVQDYGATNGFKVYSTSDQDMSFSERNSVHVPRFYVDDPEKTSKTIQADLFEGVIALISAEVSILNARIQRDLAHLEKQDAPTGQTENAIRDAYVRMSALDSEKKRVENELSAL